MKYEKPEVVATLTEEEIFGADGLMISAWGNVWGNQWKNGCEELPLSVVVRPC